MIQPGFFDLSDRYKKLDQTDSLRHLNELIDWEVFSETLEKARELARQTLRKSHAGRKPFDSVLIFKVLVLQHLYIISDDQTEFQIRDRYTFCRFLNCLPEDRILDAKTIWDFREILSQAKTLPVLFDEFDQQLNTAGFKAQQGQMIDASFVGVPHQRNKRENNEKIKADERPAHFNEKPGVGRQKDTDARWAKKNQETHFGYKNHVSVDNQHKLIGAYEVLPDNVHDSRVFEDIFSENEEKEVWADSAYYSEENERTLTERGLTSRVHDKGYKNNPLSDVQKEQNRKKSSIRVRIEHVFGSMTNEQGGLFFKVIGHTRNATKIGMMHLVYNMRRVVTLHRLRAPVMQKE